MHPCKTKTKMKQASAACRLTCRGLARPITTIPTAALETPLNPPPLHRVIIGEAILVQLRMSNSRNYRDLDKPEISEFVGERTPSMYTDHMTPKYTFNIFVNVKITNRAKSAKNSHPDNMLVEMPGTKTGQKPRMVI